MSDRTASEIRAYCEWFRDWTRDDVWDDGEHAVIYFDIGLPDNDTLDTVHATGENRKAIADALSSMLADLPRALEAAVKLREMVQDMRGYPTECGRLGTDWAADRVLDDTKWLAELSPETPLSPDGENEEESER